MVVILTPIVLMVVGIPGYIHIDETGTPTPNEGLPQIWGSIFRPLPSDGMEGSF